MKEMNWKKKENKQFLQAVLSIKNTDEAERFLRDIMTEGEIREFSNRLEAARMLSKSFKYEDIVKKTGLSSTTVARISKWLNGPLGGYRIVLPRLTLASDKKASDIHYHTRSKLGKGLSLNV
jgi:TrpR-related protein YerC/YecD